MPSQETVFDRAVHELSVAVNQIAEADIDLLVDRISDAHHVSVFGCGREGLQIRGFAMRLFHLGRSVSVVGDMSTPPIGPGDLFLVTAGPGMLPTALALAGVARTAGARVMCITADPEGAVPRKSDDVLVLPAQTMATDQGDDTSSLPMGSVYEGGLFLLFEIAVLKLKHKLGVSDETMRANHTNLE
jgi:6-phospho-3-hexuloisomerase